MPESERPQPIILVDGKTETGAKAVLQQAVSNGREVAFSVVGEAGKPRSMSWLAKLTGAGFDGEMPLCRTPPSRHEGIRRTYAPKPIVTPARHVQGVGWRRYRDPGGELSFERWADHTMVRKLPEGFVLQRLAASIVTDNDSGKLTLERLEFLQEVPAIFNPAITAEAPSRLDSFPSNWKARPTDRFRLGSRQFSIGISPSRTVPGC